jgi:hypothetical protein
MNVFTRMFPGVLPVAKVATRPKRAVMLLEPGHETSLLQQKMHAAELRPLVTKAAHHAASAERNSAAARRLGASHALVEAIPRLQEHQLSPNGHRHLSFIQLFDDAELQTATLDAVNKAYIAANRDYR